MSMPAEVDFKGESYRVLRRLGADTWLLADDAGVRYVLHVSEEHNGLMDLRPLNKGEAR